MRRRFESSENDDNQRNVKNPVYVEKSKNSHNIYKCLVQNIDCPNFLSRDIQERRLQILGFKLYAHCANGTGVSHDDLVKRTIKINKMFNTNFRIEEIQTICELKNNPNRQRYLEEIYKEERNRRNKNFYGESYKEEEDENEIKKQNNLKKYNILLNFEDEDLEKLDLLTEISGFDKNIIHSEIIEMMEHQQKIKAWRNLTLETIIPKFKSRSVFGSSYILENITIRNLLLTTSERQIRLNQNPKPNDKQKQLVLQALKNNTSRFYEELIMTLYDLKRSSIFYQNDESLDAVGMLIVQCNRLVSYRTRIDGQQYNFVDMFIENFDLVNQILVDVAKKLKENKEPVFIGGPSSLEWNPNFILNLKT
jgi:hypothetical protein